jgi:hypothetical protein
MACSSECLAIMLDKKIAPDQLTKKQFARTSQFANLANNQGSPRALPFVQCFSGASAI